MSAYIKSMLEKTFWTFVEAFIGALIAAPLVGIEASTVQLAAMAGAGVSMRLRACQIVKLVEGGSSNAKGYGFESVKDGYEQPEAVAEENVSQETQADF